MNLQPHLLAAALLLVPVSASAQSADCKAGLDQIASQLEALSPTANSRAKVGVSAALSGRTITLNRMATASQNPETASLVPADRAPSGAEGRLPEPTAKPANAGSAHAIALAQSAWQVAMANHARGNEAGCQRELADARSKLDSIKG